MGRSNILGSYKLVSKMKIKMAHLIQRMYSFLFISEKNKKQGLAWGTTRHGKLCSGLDQEWTGI